MTCWTKNHPRQRISITMTTIVTTEDIRELFGRHADAYIRKDSQSLATCYADCCVIESPTFGRLTSRTEIESSFRNWFDAFPDATVELDHLLITGNRVAQAVTLHGTDTG